MLYLVLTAKDMIVERFCMGSRGFHDSIIVPGKVRVKSCLFTRRRHPPPRLQYLGLCAWLYEVPAYGPPGQALVAPNGIWG